MAQKIIQMQMRHLNFNLKDLFSNRKGFVILTSLLRFKNKSREFRERGIIVRGLSLVIWKGLAVGGGLKIGGQREGILWSTKHSERI